MTHPDAERAASRDRHPPVGVGLFGIPRQEERRLRATFAHSMTRSICYAIQSPAEGPAIWMVNADDASSLVAWQRSREAAGRAAGREPSTVLVSRDREFQTRHFQVKRPLISSRVISVLDRIAEQELGLSEAAAVARESLAFTQSLDLSAYRLRALVVDDSLPVRIQLDQALKPLGIGVDFAESGEQAYELLEENNYDVVFLDVILPGVDGYEICKSIKDGAHPETPVIMLTGNSSPADRIKGELAGCDTYLIKPIGKAVFKEVVSRYLVKEETAVAGVGQR